jgi:thioredoxin-dependent peroxiredoxin
MDADRDQYATLFKNGRGVVLIAISADPDTALASWARDSEFPFLFASDSSLAVARQYGAVASEPGLTNRNLFVVGPDGRISYRAVPFREIDPSAYKALGAAVQRGK